MILFTDNDIFLKLAGCNLLIPFFEAIDLEHEKIFLSPSAKFSLSSQIEKKLTNQHIKEELNNVLNKINYLSQDTNTEPDLIDKLAEVPNLDLGEGFLFLAAYANPNSKLATGDKRALKALLNNSEIENIKVSLFKRVYTFELALLLLMKKLGFEEVSQKVSNRCIDDKVLELAYGNNRNYANAMACLSSYTREFKYFLAHPELLVNL